MNKSEIRSKILKLRKRNFNRNFKIDIDKFFSFLKINKFDHKIFGGYYPSNFEISDLHILELLDKKEEEIQELNKSHQNFKNEIEANQKKYERIIDETADEISNFVEKAKLENASQ